MNNIQIKNIKGYKKGFGILEVLVSALIIITILSALVFVGKTAIANSLYIQQRAQATYLAQEGIELVRDIRDTNWIDGNNATQWNSLKFDSAKTALTSFTNGDYRITNASNIYGLEAISGSVKEETITINNMDYNRKITISGTGNLVQNDSASGINVDPANNAVKISVTVGWKYKNYNRNISVGEILTNWRPNY